MNKLAGIGLCTLVGVAAAAPYVNGYLAEQALVEWVAELDGRQGVHMTLANIERGYLSSHTSIDMRLSDVTGERPELSVHIPLEITHKINGVSVLGSVQGADTLKEMLHPYLGELPILTLQADVELLTGETEGTVRSAGVNKEEDSLTIVVDEANMHFEGNAYDGILSLDLNWPGMRLTGEQEGALFSLETLTMSQTGEQISPFLWIGDSNFRIKRIEGKSVESSIVLENIQMTSVSHKASETRLDATMALDIENTLLNGKSLSSQHVEFSLTNLALAEFDALMASVDKLQATNDMTDPAQAELQLAQVEKTMEQVSKMLAQGANFSIDKLKLNTGKGAISGALKIEQPAVDPATTLLLTKTNGQLQIQAPVALFENSPVEMRQQLDMLLAQGFLIEKDGFYINQSKLADMVLDVNGMQIPLPPLF